MVARLGGEEFAVLFVDTDGPAAHQATVRIADELARGPDGDVVALSISAGVAERGDELEAAKT